jgi:uncharacterized SAM-binding protein YcdF (DUF218 family)
MYFILSKLLLIFIYPFTWFLAFFLAAFLIRNPTLKRRFFIVSAAILLIFSNPFLYNQFAKQWNIQPVPLKAGQYSCVIVLGGFSGEDANGNGFFNGSADRFIQGLKLVTTGKAAHILISGGNGSLVKSQFAEGDWVKTQLLQLKVADSSIISENRSRNTLENAAFSKILLAEKHLQPPYLLVTSGFHMRRSLKIFKKAGVEVTPYPCDFFAGNQNFSFDLFIPDGATFAGWNIYIKEVVGVIYNRIRG